MTDQKKNYYDEYYTTRDIRKSPVPTLTKLSVMLSRFSLPSSKVILDLLKPGERFLDLGCGDGLFAIKAKKKFSEIYGIDISNVAVKMASEVVQNREDKQSFRFLVCDADNKLPFQDSFFDAVTCIAVLEHATHPPTMLKEIRRILKSKGELIILIPNDAWLPYRLQYLMGKIPASGGVDEMGVDWGHLHKFNKEMVTKLLPSVGYYITEITCSGIFAKFRKKWLSLLAGDIIVKAVKC